MNDFTKEELRKLLHGLGLINDIPCMVLENKIQSMIYNYCEHENCPNCNLSPHPANVDCINLESNYE